MSRRPHVAVTLTQRLHRVPGGTSTSIERLLAALVEADRADLTAVEPHGDIRRPATLLRAATSATPVNKVDTANVDPAKVDVARLGLPLPFLYDSWTRFGRPKIASAVDDLDLVHLTVPVAPPDDAVPLVATVHDLFPLTHPELMTSRGSKLMRAGLERIRKRAHHVMVPTEFVAEQCGANGFDENRITVVPWGVEPPAACADPDEATTVLERHGITAPYVLFVGTIEPRKNLGLLLDAMVRLARPEVSLVLAGPSGWGDALTSGEGTQLGDIPSPVVRLGYLAEADLAHLERGAGAFCFPSLAEGFGLPVLEAMSAGAAVITSAGTASAEVAGDGAVLIDPHSADELADAISMLLDDPARSAELRRLGQLRAEQFSWSRAAELTLDVYEAALS